MDDLTNWTYHGVCYESPNGNPLFAPDVVQKGDTFYLYAAENSNLRITVSKSKNPAGPFTDTVLTELGHDASGRVIGGDVGILVDDDGSVYAYWGFGKACCAQLNDDMATIKEGTLHENFIGHCRTDWTEKDEFENPDDGFYEAASPRKINGKYVFVYSKFCSAPLPAYGLNEWTSMFLSYHYSDHPLTGYKRGGDISYNCGEVVSLPDGSRMSTYEHGNNHGGLAEIDGQWYVFYHRHTGLNCNSTARQAMLEPIDVAMDPDGNVFIGRITYEDGIPVAQQPVEMTSQGPHTNGLDAFSIISAAYTCHISGGTQKTYVSTVWDEDALDEVAVKDITNGTVLGYRYLQFGTEASAKTLTASICAYSSLTVRVRVDSYQGEIIAEASMKAEETEVTAVLTK
ncbi:MAG: family 43 glycosylhydrolase, partial [Clostridia bacterium]|nr:family 43 glycosylhydrolase [Clostridia bacterium]